MSDSCPSQKESVLASLRTCLHRNCFSQISVLPSCKVAVALKIQIALFNVYEAESVPRILIEPESVERGLAWRSGFWTS